LLGLVNAGLAPNTAFYQWSVYTLYLFHMPAFFFLAGLMVQRSLDKGAGPFLVNKLWTVAYPYVLWSFSQGSLKQHMPSGINTPITGSLIQQILWDPFDHFWFLYALMAWHLAALVLRGRPFALLAVAVSAMLVAWLIPDKLWSADDILNKIAREG